MDFMQKHNKAILDFAYRNKAVWQNLTASWIQQTFEQSAPAGFEDEESDILVTVIK
jgi:hypothetical protein